MGKSKLIIITGPENTGKSTLCLQLAQHFSGVPISEYARAYLQEKNGPYSIQDLHQIGLVQKKQILATLETGVEWIFVDTWIFVLMIWAKIKFGHIPPIFETWENEIEVTGFLLCSPDLPWELDPMREHKNEREGLFEIYLQMLESQGAPFKIVSGKGENRLKSALEGLSRLNINI